MKILQGCTLTLLTLTSVSSFTGSNQHFTTLSQAIQNVLAKGTEKDEKSKILRLYFDYLDNLSSKTAIESEVTSVQREDVENGKRPPLPPQSFANYLNNLSSKRNADPKYDTYSDIKHINELYPSANTSPETGFSSGASEHSGRSHQDVFPTSNKREGKPFRIAFGSSYLDSLANPNHIPPDRINLVSQDQDFKTADADSATPVKLSDIGELTAFLESAQVQEMSEFLEREIKKEQKSPQVEDFESFGRGTLNLDDSSQTVSEQKKPTPVTHDNTLPFTNIHSFAGSMQSSVDNLEDLSKSNSTQVSRKSDLSSPSSNFLDSQASSHADTVSLKGSSSASTTYLATLSSASISSSVTPSMSENSSSTAITSELSVHSAIAEHEKKIENETKSIMDSTLRQQRKGIYSDRSPADSNLSGASAINDVTQRKFETPESSLPYTATSVGNEERKTGFNSYLNFLGDPKINRPHTDTFVYQEQKDLPIEHTKSTDPTISHQSDMATYTSEKSINKLKIEPRGIDLFSGSNVDEIASIETHIDIVKDTSGSPGRNNLDGTMGISTETNENKMKKGGHISYLDSLYDKKIAAIGSISKYQDVEREDPTNRIVHTEKTSVRETNDVSECVTGNTTKESQSSKLSDRSTVTDKLSFKTNDKSDHSATPMRNYLDDLSSSIKTAEKREKKLGLNAYLDSLLGGKKSHSEKKNVISIDDEIESKDSRKETHPLKLNFIETTNISEQAIDSTKPDSQHFESSDGSTIDGDTIIKSDIKPGTITRQERNYLDALSSSHTAMENNLEKPGLSSYLNSLMSQKGTKSENNSIVSSEHDIEYEGLMKRTNSMKSTNVRETNQIPERSRNNSKIESQTSSDTPIKLDTAPNAFGIAGINNPNIMSTSIQATETKETKPKLGSYLDSLNKRKENESESMNFNSYAQDVESEDLKKPTIPTEPVRETSSTLKRSANNAKIESIDSKSSRGPVVDEETSFKANIKPDTSVTTGNNTPNFVPTSMEKEESHETLSGFSSYLDSLMNPKGARLKSTNIASSDNSIKREVPTSHKNSTDFAFTRDNSNITERPTHETKIKSQDSKLSDSSNIDEVAPLKYGIASGASSSKEQNSPNVMPSTTKTIKNKGMKSGLSGYLDSLIGSNSAKPGSMSTVTSKEGITREEITKPIIPADSASVEDMTKNMDIKKDNAKIESNTPKLSDTRTVTDEASFKSDTPMSAAGTLGSNASDKITGLNHHLFPTESAYIRETSNEKERAIDNVPKTKDLNVSGDFTLGDNASSKSRIRTDTSETAGNNVSSFVPTSIKSKEHHGGKSDNYKYPGSLIDPKASKSESINTVSREQDAQTENLRNRIIATEPSAFVREFSKLFTQGKDNSKSNSKDSNASIVEDASIRPLIKSDTSGTPENEILNDLSSSMEVVESHDKNSTHDSSFGTKPLEYKSKNTVSNQYIERKDLTKDEIPKHAAFVRDTTYMLEAALENPKIEPDDSKSYDDLHSDENVSSKIDISPGTLGSKDTKYLDSMPTSMEKSENYPKKSHNSYLDSLVGSQSPISGNINEFPHERDVDSEGLMKHSFLPDSTFDLDTNTLSDQGGLHKTNIRSEDAKVTENSNVEGDASFNSNIEPDISDPRGSKNSNVLPSTVEATFNSNNKRGLSSYLDTLITSKTAHSENDSIVFFEEDSQLAESNEVTPPIKSAFIRESSNFMERAIDAKINNLNLSETSSAIDRSPTIKPELTQNGPRTQMDTKENKTRPRSYLDSLVTSSNAQSKGADNIHDSEVTAKLAAPITSSADEGISNFSEQSIDNEKLGLKESNSSMNTTVINDSSFKIAPKNVEKSELGASSVSARVVAGERNKTDPGSHLDGLVDQYLTSKKEEQISLSNKVSERLLYSAHTDTKVPKPSSSTNIVGSAFFDTNVTSDISGISQTNIDALLSSTIPEWPSGMTDVEDTSFKSKVSMEESITPLVPSSAKENDGEARNSGPTSLLGDFSQPNDSKLESINAVSKEQEAKSNITKIESKDPKLPNGTVASDNISLPPDTRIHSKETLDTLHGSIEPKCTGLVDNLAYQNHQAEKRDESHLSSQKKVSLIEKISHFFGRAADATKIDLKIDTLVTADDISSKPGIASNVPIIPGSNFIDTLSSSAKAGEDDTNSHLGSLRNESVVNTTASFALDHLVETTKLSKQVKDTAQKLIQEEDYTLSSDSSILADTSNLEINGNTTSFVTTSVKSLPLLESEQSNINQLETLSRSNSTQVPTTSGSASPFHNYLDVLSSPRTSDISSDGLNATMYSTTEAKGQNSSASKSSRTELGEAVDKETKSIMESILRRRRKRLAEKEKRSDDWTASFSNANAKENESPDLSSSNSLDSSSATFTLHDNRRPDGEIQLKGTHRSTTNETVSRARLYDPNDDESESLSESDDLKSKITTNFTQTRVGTSVSVPVNDDVKEERTKGGTVRKIKEINHDVEVIKDLYAGDVTEKTSYEDQGGGNVEGKNWDILAQPEEIQESFIQETKEVEFKKDAWEVLDVKSESVSEDEPLEKTTFDVLRGKEDELSEKAATSMVLKSANVLKKDTSILEKVAMAVKSTKEMWETLSPIKIQGGSLKTCTFDNSVERVEIFLKTYGRPMHSNVELWNAPGNVPLKVQIYTENGDSRPFRATIETPGEYNTIAVHNAGDMVFPLVAAIEAKSEGNSDVPPPKASGKIEPKILQGSAVLTEKFSSNVSSVQVKLETDGRPLNASVELLQGPNNNRQVMDIFSEDGQKRPFCVVIETPGLGSVVSVINKAEMVFPLTASVEPFLVSDESGRDDSDSMTWITPRNTK